jgi:hypothetical protein
MLRQACHLPQLYCFVIRPAQAGNQLMLTYRTVTVRVRAGEDSLDLLLKLYPKRKHTVSICCWVPCIFRER